MALNYMLDHSSSNNNTSNGGSSGGTLPPAIVADYKKLLQMAIEIFQNNFSPQDILRLNAGVDKIL